MKSSKSSAGLSLPLKDRQIKVVKRDRVLINKKTTSAERKEKIDKNQYWGYYQKKKIDYKEYDLKTNEIIERRRKVKTLGSEDTDSDF